MKRLQPRGSFAKEEVMRERLRWLIDALISRCGVILQGFSHSVQLVPPLQPNISPLCPALLCPPPPLSVSPAPPPPTPPQQSCPCCSWTGSSPSTCWCPSWCWRASERASTSLSQGCRTRTSGAAKQSGITRWWPA